jgi:hypothetical protein
MKTAIAYGLLALFAAVVGRIAHHSSAPAAAPICAGGMENAISLDVLPTRVDRLPQGERLTFSVRLAHQLRGQAKIRYAIELLDDTGRAVAPVSTSPIQELRPLTVLEGSPVVLPEGLADGDYQVRITAAARSSGDGEPSTLIHTLYVRRRGGAFSELSAGEWFQATRANAGQVLQTAVLSPARLPKAPASRPAPAVTPCPSPQGTGAMGTPTTCTPPPPDPPPVASGTASGQLAFFNHQGNFCPTGRDCFGAKYTQAEFNAVLPVRETRVYIRRASDARIIGQGATDAAGNFSIGWTIPNSSDDVSADLIWVGEQKDGRFAVRSDTGAQYVFWTFPFTLHNGGSDFIGTLVWGDAQNPNPLANVYDGAWRAWSEFSLSNRMLAYFNNVELRAFSSQCPTSCAFGADNRVFLDPDSAYEPQARVMHEMGHIASYRSNRDQQRNVQTDYCFPNQGGDGCGWTMNGPEWASVGFEEALATFYADTSLYSPWARAPHSCLASAVACGDGFFNIEESHAQCGADENRWPLTTMRYLWDAFDSNVDIAGETLQRNNYEFFDTINAFDNGNANHQKDEAVCCDFFGACSLCRRDGRASSDFRANWAVWGTDSTFAFTNNCSPVGD